MAKKLRIKQIRSAIGRLENQKRTIRALGLGKLRKTVVHDDHPSIRGMIHTIRHLITVEEIDGE
ncbi:MAG: 50S ribosomal protein L30 [Chitinispirillaceae bacterium]|nr:50S ribosomal protein L30 [Chitinispirillaceae bacterium]